MAVVYPGGGLLELVQGASTRLVVAAPYIKSPALRRLISALPESITSFLCVTRWLPEDIASGVCDLEILDDVSCVKGGVLLVHPHLHAKYYAAGAQCLVGSANLTGRGLGWHSPPNVELLVSLPADFAGLREWEAALIQSAVRATVELRDQLRKEAERLKAANSVSRPPEVEASDAEEYSGLWVPACPVPDRLWLVYQGRGADRMVSSAYESALRDLEALRPPNGLAQPLFEAYVSGILRQMPVMAEIDRLAASGLTDSQALEFLAEHLPPSASTSFEQSWRILKLWLTHFFPTSYRVETGQEILVRGRLLPRR
jgi:hypothetical protein